jgi:hypothetical protein
MTQYSAEPGDGGGDINYVAMAHDDGYLYINFNQASQFAYEYGTQNIYFDTDHNAATGNPTDHWWWGQSTGVGAEHSMYGSAIWHAPNLSWNGDSVAGWTYYGNETGDILIKIDRLMIGDPQSGFDFVARMFATDDYYPNVGGYHQYSMTSSAPVTSNWNVASGNFTLATNWNPNASLTFVDSGIIDNGGTATVNTSGLNAARAFNVVLGTGAGNGTLEVQAGGELFVGNHLRLGTAGSTGTVTQSGGLVTVGGLSGPDNNLRIGFDGGGTGSYILNAGELAVADTFTIGHEATGTFTMNGGVVSHAGWIVAGNNPGGHGTFNMHGGTINQTFGDIEIGDEAVGVANLDGGTINMPAGGWRFSVGNRAAGTGTANIGGTVTINCDNFTIGKAGNGTGTISGSAVVNAKVAVTIGHDAGGVGVLTMNGGEIADDDDFLIGNSGTGTFNLNGGIISKAGWIVLGNEPGSSGTFNMTGGTVSQSFGDLEVGDAAPGVLNQSGGALNIKGNVFVAKQAGSTGDANVSGGTLNAEAVINRGTFDVSGTAVVNLVNLGPDTDPGAISGPGATTVAGTAQITADHVRQSSLTMTGGTIKIRSTGTGTASGVSVIPTVNISGAAKLNLTDNKLITASPLGSWDGSAYTGISGLVDSGRGSASNAQWDGNGIVTSDTRAVNNNDLVSIGTAKVGAIKGIADGATTTFAGQTVLGSDTIAMVTWGGDANLDGKINVDDYGQIDFNVGSSGSVFGWLNGDFNYDGKINVDDYGIIDFNVVAQTGQFSTTGGATSAALDGVGAVPEPAGLGLLALASANVLRRRRRRD